MSRSSTLKVSTPSDREISFVRAFDAPRGLVFACHTTPELVRQWLLGPAGWTMPVCEIDLRVGGRYRYVWHKAPDVTMGMGGVFEEIVAPARLVATEKFDDPWYAGEAIDTSAFVEQDGRTTLTLTVRFESREVRDGVLESGMDAGMATSYDRLAGLLTTLGATVRA